MMEPALQGRTLIGKGLTSDVLAWGDGKVLKLLHAWVPAARAEREFNATRVVHAAGLPAPAAYELIEVEGRRGIVFERIEGISMLRRAQTRPWMIFMCARQLADLQAQIHRCACPAGLPSQHDRISRGINSAQDLSTEQKQAAQQDLRGLPDGAALCHGDFHPENILFTARGPIIIDWGAATRGDPLSDIACTSRLIQNAVLPSWSPCHMHFLLKCWRTLLHRAYLKRSLQYHPGATLDQIRAWEIPIAAASSTWRTPAAAAWGVDSALPPHLRQSA